MSAQYDLVVLDFDGTLVDTRNDIVNGVLASLADLDLPGRPVDEIAGFIGRGVENLVACSLPPGRADLQEEAEGRFRHHYGCCFTDTSRPYPGVRPVLAALRDCGLLLAVASNKPTTYISRLLEIYGLGRFLFAAVGGDAMARKKPDAWCLEEIGRSCGVPAHRSLMVGDMRYDIETGINAGTDTCGVLYGYGTKEELQGAGHLVSDFTGLLPLAG